MTALKERAANLEIARIIACLIVIGCHTLLPVNIGTEYATSRVFLQCVFGDGVAVFWMLTGCFIFQKNYSEIVRRTLIKVFLPAMIFSILMFYFGLNSPLCTGQHHTLADYINLINAALAFNSPVNGQGHLWYIWVYVFIVIFLFPFTSLFVKKMDEDKKVEQKFIIIAILFVLLNDLSLNCFAEFSHHTIGGGIAGSILMMAQGIFYISIVIESYTNILLRQRFWFILRQMHFALCFKFITIAQMATSIFYIGTHCLALSAPVV